jgi:3-oxoacyl-[acyl-carrier-protein] synthase II
MEYLSLSTVFRRPHEVEVPISSNKSMIGHTLTAAGAIEAVFSLLTIAPARFRRRSITTIRTRPSSSMSCPIKRQADVTRVLSNSFGLADRTPALSSRLNPLKAWPPGRNGRANRTRH